MSSDDEDSGNDEPPFPPIRNAPGNDNLAGGNNANDLNNRPRLFEEEEDEGEEDVEIEMLEGDRAELVAVNRRIDFPVERPPPNPPRNLVQYLDLLTNSRLTDKPTPTIDALPTEGELCLTIRLF